MIFVTGGTGLVGARLIFDLVNKGEKVTALKRAGTSLNRFLSLISFYTNNNKAIEKNITWVEGDLLDFENLTKVIPIGAKVYHCAAKVSFNPKMSNNIIENNVEGTANLVNACLLKNVVKLCHVSSIGALGGKINGQQINENTPWSSVGKSAYSLSKYYSELEVWRSMAEGLCAVIVNPSVILGAGNWNQGSPQLFSMVSKGLKYYTSGTTSYVDVKDVSKAMIMLMDSDIEGERFLLASETLSYKSLFIKIADSIQVKAPYKYASKFITGVAFRLEKVRSVILSNEPKMTRQTHTISHTSDNYSGKKITEKLNFSYTPIIETIKFIGNCFVKQPACIGKQAKSKIIRYFFICFFFIVINAKSFSQCKYINTVFSSGEQFEYKVYYKLGFMWFNAAQVSFKVESTLYNNKKAYHFISSGQTLPNYDWIYKVRDSFQSIADSATLSPYSFSRTTTEGGYSVNNKYTFDYNNHNIYSTIQNSKKPLYNDTLKIEECTLDVLTAIYACRNIDISKLVFNDTILLKMLVDNKIHNLYLRYMGIEIVELKNGKKYSCKIFAVLMVEGTIFSGGEDLTVWISDDKIKIPIKVEAKILVGSIIAEIDKVKGNKWLLNFQIIENK